MVRGRKKDMTIPVSRTIALQRDYRERKAKYVSDLEDKCKSLEEQNARLNEEISELRELLSKREQRTPGPNLELLECGIEVSKKEAFGDVIKTLSAAMNSIQNFTHLAEGQRNSNSSSSTPAASVASSSSLSSRASSSSDPYSAYQMQASTRCPSSVVESPTFSSSVVGYASNHRNVTPSPSPSFADTPISQSNYQNTGNSYSASDYWNENSGRFMGYLDSDKPHVRPSQHSELTPHQGRSTSNLALEDAAQALSNLSSDVLSIQTPFRRSSSGYTTSMESDNFSGYADHMPAGQSSNLRSTVYESRYGNGMAIRNSSGGHYTQTSG
ncbi:hypothetical protein EV368DRAFT_80682 [Lentinula lateritia]|uniref:Uncharacterized protein n=1 Tax=Lentinula aff. lateritia TaxID=2804960 RepID=A0ACC1U012_9AGAR|nr:hypothetical protein F5876DRAFT_76862 [Lentinula aff. lateritia]KAJ3854336.1 hypothetical protein EV368DRAFT_80682 [Lentinula lateritia]